MMTRLRTDQETFWAGEFGNEYTVRNQVQAEQRQSFFAHVLRQTYGVRSICELGANQGHNLQAIANLSQNFELTGVELNESAWERLQAICGDRAIHASIQDFISTHPFDLVFTCGVLIHLNPDDLPAVYQKMYDLSDRYILINEYFNPVPVELHYRGHTGKLFKRDFATECIAHNEGKLAVVDYGFLWKRMNPSWDDTTWFLLEKVV